MAKSVTESVLLGVAQEKQKETAFPRRGKKINVAFEAAVLARCMELAVTKALESGETQPDDDGKPGYTAEVLATVLYKYDVVVHAAKEELKDKKRDDDTAVKQCVILHCYHRCYVHIYTLNCVITFSVSI